VGEIADPKDWKAYYRRIYPRWWQKRSKALEWSAYDQCLLAAIDASRGATVLECGIGTGERYAVRLAERGVRMYGVDLADALLREGVASAATRGVPVAFQQGDLEALPYRDAAFDRVYCFSSLWYVPDLAQAVREMFRVTRRDGLVVFDVLNALHITPWLAHLATGVKRRLGREAGPWRPWSPSGIAQVLKSCGATWRVQGFGVLLPTGLPLVGERMDLGMRWRFTATGLRDSPLRYLGAKLLYVCRPPLA
jgi:ubiquinone/menaquinone biosynthesis C-methylase UbiE